ncbi:MAG: ComEC/Rec2 family competence protein, partial [Vicinamibacterales bacterium]
LTGDDSALTAAEQEDLRRAGLSHITAVSGWNVMLVTSAVGLIFLRLGLRGWGWTLLQFVALLGFVWIVGLEPPVTRAAIMAVAGMAAIRLGRPAHSATVLTLSAALIVAVSPTALSGLSFQLSVVATAGLVVATHITHDLEGWWAVTVTPVAVTAVIGLMTAPLLATEFGTLSLATIPANLLAGPLVPLTTFGAIVIVVLSPFATLANLAGWIVWVLCSSLLWIARAVGSAPGVYHEFAPLSDSAQAGLYALLTVGTAVALPEGRLIARTTTDWARREPLSAGLGAGVACCVLVMAAVAV